MSCENVREQIALDAGGDLDATGRQRLDHHLASCAGCRRLAAEMRRSHQAVRQLAEAPIGRDLLAEVRAAVLEEIENPRRPASVLGFPSRTPRRRQWLAAAAVVLLTAAAGWWLASRGPDRPSPLPKVVRYLPPPVEPPPVEPIPSPPKETRRPVAETAAPRIAKAPEPPAPETRPTPAAVAANQPTVVKWFVDDPDLVIYWLIETEQATEETKNETTEA